MHVHFIMTYKAVRILDREHKNLNNFFTIKLFAFALQSVNFL